ncbi:L-rhamnose mutarotase [Shinella sp. 838]|uniref:L-rhamnose mutarotase n=1 Tax=Shinella sp. 838 TaxID=3038164 RepID=UPI0024153BC8|nr:L-rhamnose mutarotase [Shinella sp. 838]MDG4674908.1 L-rhamnose mutarotase [Shinella sp. 838]
MQRYGFVIGIHPDRIEEYKKIHADVWPGVLAKIRACNIRNYSIFLREPENLMFGYYEYHGIDHAADMAKMAADPITQKWWDVCMPMQRPLETRGQGDWWAPMEQVFLLEDETVTVS